MESGFFALLARMRNIRRWGLMRNTFEENIQEHSHMTAVLAHALALIRRDVFGLPAAPEQAAAVALFHDAAEIITGDMPTPVKYISGELTGAYKAVERAAEARLLRMLPEALRGGYAAVFDCGDEETKALVKAADKLAAYIKCVEELRAGNQEFRSAEAQLRKTLEASPLAEVEYFLEHFLPPFGMTLDELAGAGEGERMGL